MNDMDNRIKTIREMANEAVKRYVPTKINDYYTMTRIDVHPNNRFDLEIPNVEIEIRIETGICEFGRFYPKAGVAYKNELLHIDSDVVIDHVKLLINETIKELVIRIIEETKGVPSE